ncbi:MAG TPA: hypothetical protein VLH85_03175 [Levilinea sp.]|nr:hypothetical protein [Levilinea sp.]
MALQVRTAHGGAVEELNPGSWRLSLPPGGASQYRLAQLDDFMRLPRRRFAWQAPFELRLQARLSHRDIPGTWGFGFWNDPFRMSFGMRGAAKRLPALPNAAWFFYASAHSYLSLRDDCPAHGLLAAVFQSIRIPSALLAFGLPALPLMALRPAARMLRCMARWLVKDDAGRPEIDVTAWHEYRYQADQAGVRYWIDGAPVFETALFPRGPLGLVIWIDNQFAALPPGGAVRFGALPADELAWLEVSHIRIS